MVTTGAMTNVLDRLEKAGFIRRVKNPEDRRSVIVEATEPGTALWHAAVNELGEREASVASTLSKKEREQLNALLRKLLAAFGEESG
jgi:DNA-binding MarR family transcriptional regulator